jgi:hypothetical protein
MASFADSTGAFDCAASVNAGFIAILFSVLVAHTLTSQTVSDLITEVAQAVSILNAKL